MSCKILRFPDGAVIDEVESVPPEGTTRINAIDLKGFGKYYLPIMIDIPENLDQVNALIFVFNNVAEYYGFNRVKTISGQANTYINTVSIVNGYAIPEQLSPSIEYVIDEGFITQLLYFIASVNKWKRVEE